MITVFILLTGCLGHSQLSHATDDPLSPIPHNLNTIIVCINNFQERLYNVNPVGESSEDLNARHQRITDYKEVLYNT